MDVMATAKRLMVEAILWLLWMAGTSGCWRCLRTEAVALRVNLGSHMPTPIPILVSTLLLQRAAPTSAAPTSRLHTRLYARKEPPLISESDFPLWQTPSAASESHGDEDAQEELGDVAVDDGDEKDDSKLKEIMVEAILWYKRTLSPLMPSSCRFLPTCSSYGLDAIQKYGSIKGGVLTAWRILRCNPLGGAGYDAPVWPPPSYFAGSNTFMNF